MLSIYVIPVAVGIVLIIIAIAIAVCVPRDPCSCSKQDRNSGGLNTSREIILKKRRYSIELDDSTTVTASDKLGKTIGENIPVYVPFPGQLSSVTSFEGQADHEKRMTALEEIPFRQGYNTDILTPGPANDEVFFGEKGGENIAMNEEAEPGYATVTGCDSHGVIITDAQIERENPRENQGRTPTASFTYDSDEFSHTESAAEHQGSSPILGLSVTNPNYQTPHVLSPENELYAVSTKNVHTIEQQEGSPILDQSITNPNYQTPHVLSPENEIYAVSEKAWKKNSAVEEEMLNPMTSFTSL